MTPAPPPDRPEAPPADRPLEVFLLGGRGGGGEEVYLRDLVERPPPGVRYHAVLDAHGGVPGARPLRARAGAFNRLVHPFLWPLPGLRAYDVDGSVDVVHVHNLSTWLRLRARQPVVMTLGGGTYAHYLETYLGWPPERVRARYRRAARLYRPLGIRNEFVTPNRLDAIVVFSRFAAGYLQEFGVPPELVHVIPPGLALDVPARGGREGPFTFALVGRNPERKGAHLAVQALRAMREGGADARLLLAGDPSYPALSGDGVEGMGPLPRDEVLRSVFGRADAVLVPSLAEGYGLTAVEAMACGLPVIASRRDALPEIVGDAGLLVPPGDPWALRRAMERLASDGDTARALGRAARERFEEDHHPRRVRARLGALYRSLVRP